MSEASITPTVPGNPDANSPVEELAATETAESIFQINNVKSYVLVVSLYKFYK